MFGKGWIAKYINLISFPRPRMTNEIIDFQNLELKTLRNCYSCHSPNLTVIFSTQMNSNITASDKHFSFL
jgi:hypothetical protein